MSSRRINHVKAIMNGKEVHVSKRYGQWIKEPRESDCPHCGQGSIGLRHLDGGVELRRCDNEPPHDFEGPAFVTVPASENTRPDMC